MKGQRYALAVVGLAIVGADASAQTSIDCSGQPTQIAINDCAHAGWQVSDTELNRLWKIVKPKADARGRGQALLNEQRAWLKFRDATCEGERDDFAGGSIMPMIYWQCMDRMTIQRNAQLRAMR